MEYILISKKEYNGLLFMYSDILRNMQNCKGLKYKQCFEFKKQVIQLGDYINNHNLKLDDYIRIEE